MSGWGVLLVVAASLSAGLVFLSIVSDDLLRASTDINNQRFKMEAERTERLQYEAAVRKAEEKANTSQPPTGAIPSADSEETGEIFTADPS